MYTVILMTLASTAPGDVGQCSAHRRWLLCSGRRRAVADVWACSPTITLARPTGCSTARTGTTVGRVRFM